MKIFRTYISYIAALLSAATAVLSCSKGDFVPILDNEPAYHNRSILITGMVSDTYGQPLEDITINFKAYPHDQADASPIRNIFDPLRRNRPSTAMHHYRRGRKRHIRNPDTAGNHHMEGFVI